MKLFCSILLLISILAGCSPEAIEQARESRLRDYSRKCSIDYGFNINTDGNRNCVQQLDMQAKRQTQQAWSNLGNAMQNMTPATTTTNCNAWGNSVNCTSTTW